MSDLIYTIEYIKLPHPLEEEKSCVVGDDYHFQRTLYQVYPFYKDSKHNLPRLERKIFITDSNISEEKLKEEVCRYERNLVERVKKRQYIRIFKAWARLGVSFAASYLIWTLLWRFPWLYSTIDTGFRAVGDFLSPYAIVVMILAPSIASLYFTLTGRNSLIKIYRGIKPLELYQQLGKDHSSYFIQDIKKLRKNLEKKIGRNHPLIQRIKAIQEILYGKKWDELQGCLQCILDDVSSDPDFPWGEKKNIATMVEDLLYHLKNEMKFAPLKIISPGKEDLLPMEKHILSALSDLLSSSEFIHTREKIIQTYSRLKKATSTKKRTELTGEISSYFQKMIFLFSRCHLGQTPLPYERGTILKDLYHHLFVSFGKVSFFLRKKKPGSLFSFYLIKKMQKQISSFLNLQLQGSGYRFLKLLATPLGGALTSLGILLLAAFLTGFHLLGPDEFSIIYSWKFGHRGFLGEKVVVRDYSYPAIFSLQGLKIFWQLPKPFNFVHNVSLTKIYSTKVFVILQETEPSGLLDRFFHLFREEWGTGYSGVNLQFTYKVVEPQLWARYDYDGRGKERLSRDLEAYVSQYTEKTRARYREKLYRESPDEIQSHLKKCLAQGKVKEWIRRFLYPSLLDTYRTGSMYERYLTGLRWLKEHPRMRDNPEWQKFVEHEIENIEKLAQNQNEELISQPLKVKRIMNNPTISNLQEYENLYRTINFLVVEDLINQKIINQIKSFPGPESSDPLAGGIVEWIHKNSQLEELIGIRIIDVKRSLRRVSALGWQNELRKRQNLI